MPPHGNGNGNGTANGSARPKRPEKGLTGDPIIDRLPPQNLEAEQGVLGSVLLDNDALHDIAPILKAEDFYVDKHQLYWKAIRDLYDIGKPIDAITLSEELIRRGDFERAGGDETLSTLLTAVPNSANGTYYAHIVREKATVRNVIDCSNDNLRDCYSNSFTAAQVLEAAERRIFSIAEEQVQGETVELGQIVVDAMERIVRRSEEKHPVTGISTGYFELDDMTSGFQGSQLIILAARPSMGKTALALNICEHVAIDAKKAVLFVSLEMGELELAERLLCSRSRVDGHKLRTGRGLANREMTMLGKAYEELRAGATLFIDDTPSRNMLQVTANARRLKLRHDIGLIVIDYIQLVDAEDGRDSRQEQIAKISRRLKVLARELNVPVVALSQLNRAVENREDRRPRMADLRESGAIEQDADLVLLLHRPEYYDPNDQPGIAELIVAKNRSGATGTVKMTFLKNHMRFENLATVADPIDAGAF